jgi:hypothetical protein
MRVVWLMGMEKPNPMEPPSTPSTLTEAIVALTPTMP